MTDLTADVPDHQGHHPYIVAVVFGISVIIVVAAISAVIFFYSSSSHSTVSASQPCDAGNGVYFPKKVYVIDAFFKPNVPSRADVSILTDPNVVKKASCAELYSQGGNEEKAYLPDNLSPQVQRQAIDSLYSAMKTSGYYSEVVIITPPKIIGK